jgi:hypothetical protein
MREMVARHDSRLWYQTIYFLTCQSVYVYIIVTVLIDYFIDYCVNIVTKIE